MIMCPEHEILSAYIDGEILSPWDKHIEQHILSCKACKDKLESYKKLRTTLSQVSEPDITLPMQRVWNKITQARKNFHLVKIPFWQKRISLPMPFVALAAALVICIGFVLVFNTMKPDSSTVNIITHKDDGSMTEVNITANDVKEIEALLKALEKNNTPNEVIIKMPEGSNEFQVGEPELIRAIDFKRKSKK